MKRPPASDWDAFHPTDSTTVRKTEDASVTDIDHCDAPQSSVTRAGAGSVDYSIEGPAPRNEEGTLKIARIVAARWSADSGILWHAEPYDGREVGVDAHVVSSQGRRAVQVTRVLDPLLAKALNTAGTAQGQVPAAEAAHQIWLAIERKKIAAAPEVVLILDARHPGLHLLTSVIEEFTQRFGSRLLREITYGEVWLVGFEPYLCVRLK